MSQSCYTEITKDQIPQSWDKWPSVFDQFPVKVYTRKLGIETKTYLATIIMVDFPSVDLLKRYWESIQNQVAVLCQSGNKKLIERSNFYLFLLTPELPDKWLRKRIETDTYCAKKYVVQKKETDTWEDLLGSVEHRIFSLPDISVTQPAGKIKSIHIRNFRAYTDPEPFDFTHEGSGEAASLVMIYAGNGSGKTSLCDSIEWLLTDKVSRIAQMSKDVGDPGMVLHNNTIHDKLEDFKYEERAAVKMKITDGKREKEIDRIAGISADKKHDTNKVGKGGWKARSSTSLNEIIPNGKSVKWEQALMPHHQIESFINATNPKDRYTTWMKSIDPTRMIQKGYLESLKKVEKIRVTRRNAKNEAEDTRKAFQAIEEKREAVQFLLKQIQEFNLSYPKEALSLKEAATYEEYLQFISEVQQRIGDYDLCKNDLALKLDIIKGLLGDDGEAAEAAKRKLQAMDVSLKEMNTRITAKESQVQDLTQSVSLRSRECEVLDTKIKEVKEDMMPDMFQDLEKTYCSKMAELIPDWPAEELEQFLERKALFQVRVKEQERRIRLAEQHSAEMEQLKELGRRMVQGSQHGDSCECPFCHTAFPSVSSLLSASLQVNEELKEELNRTQQSIDSERMQLEEKYQEHLVSCKDVTERYLAELEQRQEEERSAAEECKGHLQQEKEELTVLQEEQKALLQARSELEHTLSEIERLQTECAAKKAQQALLHGMINTGVGEYFQNYQTAKECLEAAEIALSGVNAEYDAAVAVQNQEAEKLQEKLRQYFQSNLFESIYKKIDPHPLTEGVAYEISTVEENDKLVPTLKFVVTDKEGKTYSPEWFFSTAQLNTVTLSAFLSRSIGGKEKLPLDLVMIDDPVGHFDGMNILDFCDLIRCILEQTNKQLVLTTHDTTVYNIFRRKLSPEYYKTKFICLGDEERR